MSKPKQRLNALTLTELKPIVEDYHRAFPDWYILKGKVLARESGPILQVIGFERLWGGSYRPVGGICYLCLPRFKGFWGHQFLSGKQSIGLTAHPEMRDEVVAAIRQEIVPPVETPLATEQVLALHQAQASTRGEALVLAVLHAYLGHLDQALAWCDQFPKLVEAHGFGAHYQHEAFWEALIRWIEAGVAKQELDRLVHQERRRWGLV